MANLKISAVEVKEVVRTSLIQVHQPDYVLCAIPVPGVASCFQEEFGATKIGLTWNGKFRFSRWSHGLEQPVC